MGKPLGREDMRIGFVSTYAPQRCGIASYTEALARAVSEHLGRKVVVLAERAATAADDGRVECLPCFDRRERYARSLQEAAERAELAVVHVQHTPDILGMDQRLLELLAFLRSRGTRSVVTLHTVFTPLAGAFERRFGVGTFHRRLAALADALIVHGDGMMPQELVRQGVPAEKIHVIPHGTSLIETPAREDSRRRLDLPISGKLLLYFGFIHIQKNLHTVLRALARLPDRTVRLVVAGSIQNRAWYNRLYLRACRILARALGLGGRVSWREGFVPAGEVNVLYGAADLVVLPYAQRYGSASGVVHNALGAGRLVLCSDSPKFAEIAEQVSDRLIAPTHDPDAWAERITALLADHEEPRALLARMREHARATSWSRVAEQHASLYDELLGGRRAG